MKNKVVINPNFLNDYFNPLSGLGDDSLIVKSYSNIDVNNQEQVKKIITEQIKPAVLDLPALFQIEMKSTLSYYLTVSNKIDFGSVFDSEILPFEHPDNPRDFFVWIWEVMFDGEPYYFDGYPDVMINDSLEDVNEFYRKIKQGDKK